MAFQRRKAVWHLPSGPVTLGVQTLLAARINLSQGSHARKANAAAALDLANELEAAGADLVELNPGPRTLRAGLPSPTEELPRLVPVLRKLGPHLSIPIAVLTANTDTAQRAFEFGATVIHDPTGLAYDRDLAPAANEADAALILGHMRGSPEQWRRLEPLLRLYDHVRTELRASLLRAHKAGIERRKIVLDPGLEHGKHGHENFKLLRSLSTLVPPGQGIQVTLAGKRFFLGSVRATPDQRKAGLTVAATLALESGAHMLTVERPQALRDAVAVVDRIYRADEAGMGFE